MTAAPTSTSSKTNVDLWPIGNCQVSALVDRAGRFVWACVPRVDGDPLFSALVGGAEPDSGYWGIAIENSVSVEQHYIRNTPILVSTHTDDAGNALEVIDFCPRFVRSGRTYRPVAFARIVRPLRGSPRVTMQLRTTCGWGGTCREQIGGSNHLRILLDSMQLRLTTTAPIGMVQEERTFRLERPLHFFLGPDESFSGDLAETLEAMLTQTIAEWQEWVRGLAIPLEWQDVVIRSAITLKLCQHEETGAIVAALTTSIPEHAGSERNWDYRYCWIRDAYYTVQALNRLGALDVLEGYLGYLRNIVDSAAGGHIQPLYGVLGEATLEERFAPALAGYRGMGPVRVGNQAYEQIQHDAYGQIVLCSWNMSANARGSSTTSPMPACGSCAPGRASTPIPARCAGRRATGSPMPRTRSTCPIGAISGRRAPIRSASISRPARGAPTPTACRRPSPATTSTPA
jgi:hypothetical protein